MAFTAGGLVTNREGATDARQEMLVYSVDTGTGGRVLGVWASADEPMEPLAAERTAAPLEDAFPWKGSALWHGPAPVARLAPPEVTVVRNHIENGQRKLTLHLRSQRDARTLGLWVDNDSATVRSATVAGRAVPNDRALGMWSFGFRFFGAPANGVEVQLELAQRTDHVVLRVADSTDDLSAVPSFSPPPEGRVLVEPEVVVTRKFAL